MPDPGRATLSTVARAAGVSRQTVSNVLNTPERVGPETAARVRAAIAAQRYVPSTAARQLRTRRSSALGLRLQPAGDGINGSVLDRFLHALTEQAQAAGYRVVLFTAPDDTAETLAYEHLLRTADLDGFVLTSTHQGDPRTAWLTEHDVPFVTFGRPWDTVDDAGQPWVDVDGAAGTRAATEHLLAAGHRRTAFLGWPDGSEVGDDRRRGWEEAVAAAGAEPGPRLQSVDDVRAARALVTDLLRDAGDDAPTALVCASDSLALGAHGSTLRTGLPLEVVGFDDTPVAAALGLSSVAQPLAEAAAAAVEQLLDRLEGRTAPRGRLLAPRLVVRRPT
ncbi:substrate-binding domain-containing protein [Kineococcus rubinsiae]|uniref:substrate-binding domain-containing protein n=1 Tax=Kineococcus rubinsiae TaxID=2609562 RepID=UPI0014310035|nr:substrate-binding domain-containing protein [Kineococcus rubinsiae]NIZ92214.1 LacI family transcriptional regulator [Kineococcus rubinsiae]